MVPWWSRWSRLRLVKAATSNCTASTRCWVTAWEDTSMTTDPTPAATYSARYCWRSGASGVVRVPPRVPMTPAGRPAAARIDPTNCVTVVLPLVPVTPTRSRVRSGWPQKAAATWAMAGRTVPGATCTWVTARSTKCSHSSEVAPRDTASAAWRCPSVRSPGTQQNRAPASTRRLSNRTEATAVAAGSPRTSRTATPSRRSATVTTSTSVRARCVGVGCAEFPGPT